MLFVCSNVFKKILFVSVFCSISSVYCASTREEIIEEIAQLRKSIPQLQDGVDSTAHYYLNRVDEARILDATTSKWDYGTKYASLYFSVALLRLIGVDMVLLTKENAPKTYALIEATAQKLGLNEMPLVYLLSDERFFNAFASGLLHSMSIVGLGERMIKELPDTEALEFIIAHELSHVKNRHIIKSIAFYAVTTFIIKTIINRYQLTQPSLEYKFINEQNQYIPDLETCLKNNQFPSSVQLIPHINAQLVMNYAGKILIAGFISKWYSRVRERDADMTAARAIGARGGVKMFKMLKEKFEHKEQDYAILQAELAKTSLSNSRFFQTRIAVFKAFDAIVKFLGKPFRTHPEHDERIAYLEELAKAQEEATAAQQN